MKKLLLLFIAILGSSFLIYSCTKDEPLSVPKSSGISTRTLGNGISMVNGRLVFDNVSIFKNTMHTLDSLNHDSIAVQNAYAALGYTQAMFDDDSTNIPSLPVLNLWEQNMGFVSARRQAEIDEFAFTENGGDPENFTDPNFINDVVLGSLVNTNNTVQIGSRIYKYYPSGFAAMITNEDENVLNALNTLGEMPVDSMRDALNLRFVEGEPDYYFVFNTENDVVAQKPFLEARFNVHNVNDSVISLENISALDDGVRDGAVNYQWTLDTGQPNGTTTFSGTTPPDYTINSDSVKITLVAFEPDGDSDTSDIVVTRAICVLERTIPLPCGENTISFNLWKPDGVNDPNVLPPGKDVSNCYYSFTVYWGDGTKTKYTGFGFPDRSVSHKYSKEGTYHIWYEIDWYCGGGDVDDAHSCWVILHVQVRDISGESDCKKGEKSKESSIITDSKGRKHKIIGTIWAKPFTWANSKIGASTRHKRQGWFSIWYEKPVSWIGTRLEGTWYEKIKSPNNGECPCDPHDIMPGWESERNSSYQARNIHGSNKPGAKHHSMKPT